MLLGGLTGCAKAQPTPDAGASYPLRTVFEEHRSACHGFTNREEAASRVTAAGWQNVPDISETPMAPSIERTDEFGAALRSRPGGGYEPVLLFTKYVAGERMYISVTDTSLAGRRMVGCRLFDLGETRQIDQAEAEKLVGRPVSQVQGAQGIQVLLWMPGLVEPQPNFEIWQIPPDSPAAIENKFDGVMLRADFIGAPS